MTHRKRNEERDYEKCIVKDENANREWSTGRAYMRNGTRQVGGVGERGQGC